MWTHRREAPSSMPVLSRGKHRSARKGACFMEMASFLAGERWSDHPACTHPLLAELARMVNDYSPDADRQHLAPLIPDVIGLTGSDIRIDAELALRCAQVALPVAAAERQRILAVGILACERILAPEGESTAQPRPESRTALESAPEAWSWANAFTRGMTVSHRMFRTQSAPRIVGLAVEGIAHACVPDPSLRLRSLLEDGIAIVSALVPAGAGAPDVPTSQPLDAAVQI